MDSQIPDDIRRLVPPVHELLQRPEVERLSRRFGRAQVREVVREMLDRARTELRQEELTPEALSGRLNDLPGRLEDQLSRRELSLRTVINATGVVLHTNLGRAPLSEPGLEALGRLGGSYLNVELDLETGARGRRASGVGEKLRHLTGCEASLVVNNNAAAVLLVLDTVGRGGEVVVSRGELVEIGGAFRIPDVMRKSGAQLVEVGTTNRTRIGDYEGALTPETRALLKVHPSNFRIVGFTEEASLREMADLARTRGLVSIFDLGSGALRIPRAGAQPALSGEITVSDALAAGLDLVTFSGDKLLGGPQCGIVAGRRELIQRARRNPLYRALRVDKTILLLLEATLASYEKERESELVPACRLLSSPVDELRDRTRAVLSRLGSARETLNAAACDTQATAGGGSAPLDIIPSAGISLKPPRSCEEVLAWLRAADPPIVARIESDVVLLDFRTIFPNQDAAVIVALSRPFPAN